MIILNDKEYARVSEIISEFSDFSHIDPDILRRKQEIGTNVHYAIEEYVKGGFPILSQPEYGYFESFQRWFRQIKPIFMINENRYFDHKRMITGCIDALVMLPNHSLPTLIDFKTSVSENSIAWPMQAHLYGDLLKCNGVDVEPRYLFLKLRKDGGNPGVYPYYFNQNIHIKCTNAVEKYWSLHKKLD